MTGVICTLSLPAHGLWTYAKGASKPTTKAVSSVIRAFGDISVMSPKAQEGLLQYDAVNKYWRDSKDTKVKDLDPVLVEPALTSRLNEITASLTTLTTPQSLISQTKTRFLTSAPPAAPKRSLPLDHWRNTHTAWLDDRVADFERLSTAPYSRQERSFRAAANVLAKIPRPFPLDISLYPSASETAYLGQLEIPPEAWHYGLALKVDGTKLKADNTLTIPASEHGGAIVLSQIAAFVCALGRFASEDETTLAIQVVAKTSNDPKPLGSFVTEPGAWPSLLSVFPNLKTSNFDLADGFHLSVDPSLMLSGLQPSLS